MMVIDAHLDLAYNVKRGRDVTRPAAEQPFVQNETATVGLPDLRRGNVGLICATIFALPHTEKEPGYRTADEAQVAGFEQLQWYMGAMKAGEIDLVTTRDEVPTTADYATSKSVPAILLMEGADPIVDPERDLKMWFDAGVRIIGMAWRRTRFCGGTGEPGPLTPLGVTLAKQMDTLGMIHDASHLAEESFWQLCDVAKGPLFASHSNCRSIVPTDRQLSDEMIKAIVARGGVIGINFFDKFLMRPDEYKTRRAHLGDLVAHIDHICQLVGSARHVGLGTDMDGGLGREHIPQEIVTAGDLPRVGDGLRAAGYGAADIEAILGGNMARFFRENLPK